ncbi:MAG: DUF481 domain-containing protein [Bacteroidetes bacterium]|nr:MAG: DUF481 domain-containing protein [Bacteroidota bacterium]
MIRKTFFVCFFFLFSTLFCLGQIVNIENKRIYSDTVGWDGNLSSSLSLIQNNDQLLQFKLHGRLQYKGKKNYWLLIQNYVYSKGGQKVYANSGMGHLRHAYIFQLNSLNWETFAQAQYNQILLQKLRALVGTGPRWNFVKKPRFRAFLGSSVFYEYEELQFDPIQFNRDFRWNNYLSWFLEFKSIKFTATSYYQPLLENFSDFRYSGQYVLLNKINKVFSLKAEWNIFYDSHPPSSVPNTVMSLLFGLSMDFGK